MKNFGHPTLLLCSTVFISSALLQQAPAAPHKGSPAASTQPKVAPGAPGENSRAVGAEMQNVDFHIDSDVVLRIKRLRGELIPTRSSEPPRLDDKLSFILSIHAAEISIDTVSLSILLNRHVFGYAGSPLKNLHVSVDGDQMVQTGVMHKVVDMPFRIRATIALTPEGEIRLHPTATKVMGMNAAGLMKFFGVKIGGLIKLQPGHGARIDQNDFVLDPAAMLPPPAMRGRLTTVGIADGRLVQTFGPAVGAETTPAHRPGSTAANYMYFHGSMLRFGKLTMAKTDLEIVDNDPSNPFDYDPNRYNDHLVAGWSQTTATGGLIVHMPDLKMIPKQPTSAPRGAPGRS
jgi:hypothetical protein